MNDWRRRDVIAGAAGALALPALASPAHARAGFHQVAAGDPAPSYSVVTFDHRTFTREQLLGQVVVLNYWATWCAPCRGEMSVLDAYVRRHPEGLKVFCVSTESSLPDRYLQPLSRALAFPLAKAVAGRGFGTIGGAVPTSYVIDRAGVVRYAKAGAFSTGSFDALITPLLEADAPSGGGANVT